MIGPGTDARVLVATRPVDFRKGASSLAAMVKAAYGADPFSGVVYVFRAKRADRVKLVWWAEQPRLRRRAASLEGGVGRDRAVPHGQGTGAGRVPLAQYSGRGDAAYGSAAGRIA